MLQFFVGFIFGLVLGSFAKATADRGVQNKTLKGRSYCPRCKTTLRWYDLFPVLSYILLKGHCRACKEKIAIDNLLVELAVGVLTALLFVTTIPSLEIFLNLDISTLILSLELLFKMFFIVVLTVIFLIDWHTGLIPNKITYPAIFITILYLLLAASLSTVWQPVFLALLSGITTAGIFILLIVVTRGRGMGWGDVKYVLFLGFALGFPNITVAIFLAFFTGAIFSLILIAFGKKHFGQTIPFGPFLSLGGAIALLFGTKLINWYLASFT